MVQQTNGVYRVTTSSSLADGIMILLFTGGFFLPFTRAADVPAWTFIAAGMACIAGGVLMITLFKFSKLVAEVSEEGIVERASKVSKGLIRWEDIADVYLYEVEVLSRDTRNGIDTRQDQLVGISLVDADAYAKKLNIVQKGIMKAGLGMGYAPISIPGNMLDDPEAFVEVCKNLMKKARK